MKTTCIAAAVAALALSPSSAGADERLERGRYFATIMDCGGCHTPGIFQGKPDFQRTLAGSETGIKIPGLGIFYPPNLTPDRETGLGAWSEEEIAAAVRTGVRPDGRILAPVMPWRSYSLISEEDAGALAAYLKSLPPVKHQVAGPTGEGEKPAAPYMGVITP